jgi:hypothetical protein
MMLPRAGFAPVIVQTLDIKCGKVAKGAAPPGFGQANLEQDSQRMVKSSSRNPLGACKIDICI